MEVFDGPQRHVEFALGPIAGLLDLPIGDPEPIVRSGELTVGPDEVPHEGRNRQHGQNADRTQSPDHGALTAQNAASANKPGVTPGGDGLAGHPVLQIPG